MMELYKLISFMIYNILSVYVGVREEWAHGCRKQRKLLAERQRGT